MAYLWRDNPATPSQQALFQKATRKRRSRPTQADLLLAMLREARERKSAVELPSIMLTGIAQHGARFHELRNRGFAIENETDNHTGVLRSRYRLTFDPEREAR